MSRSEPGQGGWLAPRAPAPARSGGTVGVVRVVGKPTGRAHRSGGSRSRSRSTSLATGRADTSSRRRRDEQALLAVL